MKGYSVMKITKFRKALPVWEKGKETLMNHTIEFSTKIRDNKDYKLYIAASSSYLVFVNDTFAAHGPARAAHGFYKVDCIPLKTFLTKGENTITIRCTGYNINSFCYLDAPSFLCSEICLSGKVFAATGHNFEAYSYPAKIRKTQRYSYQRTFAEAYHLSPTTGLPVELETVSDKVFIERDVPYCEYRQLFPVSSSGVGTVTTSEKESYFNDRSITDISEVYKGFYEDTLDCGTHIEYGKLDFSPVHQVTETLSKLNLEKNEYIDLDMESNSTGLFSFSFESEDSGTLFIAFDELKIENTFNPFRNHSSNVIILKFTPGKHTFVSAEPYTFKYVRMVAQNAMITIQNFSLIEIAFPASMINAQFHSEDRSMHKIFEAALLSFRSNVVDIYMDCPSRERAGWLCDSFFTARVEKILTGHSIVERSFLESFLLPDTFEGLPYGMLPMCYPADVMNGEYIPNWAMWYALELYEYYERTNDYSLVEAAKTRMEQLLTFFQGYENESGLLANLEGVVFVDASRSNHLAWEHEISLSTNMLYAAFKSVLGILYERSDLITEARTLRKLIRELSLAETGFYCDCADSAENGITICEECTEATQYYAFFFKVATPDSDPVLWETLLHDFGYNRTETGKFKDIAPANAFIGNYLRLDLLSQYGYDEELYKNILGYFSYMAEQTGSLWEYVTPTRSCNHGYASHVLYWLKNSFITCK